MLLITGTFRIAPDNFTDALPVMARMIAASRGEDGCLDYSYAADLLEPGLIRVTERWRDQDALDTHLTSDHIREWRAAWPALGIHARDLSLHEIADTRSF